MSKGMYGTRGDIFSSVQVGKVQRSGFDLSHNVKLSLDMGTLVPMFSQEVLPGDSWNVNQNILMRFAPLMAPVMHNINCYTHFFTVPYRLLMRPGDFDAFITGGEKGDGKNDAGLVITLPFFTISGLWMALDNYGIDFDDMRQIIKEVLSPGSLYDYLGYPTAPDSLYSLDDEEFYDHMAKSPQLSVPISIFPLRAYVNIFNEYYRDQNLQDKFEEFRDYGQASDSELFQFISICSPKFRTILKQEQNDLYLKVDWLVNSKLLCRAWKKDYFTSALPFAQKGEQVTLGLSGSAPITGTAYNGRAMEGLNIESEISEVEGVSNIHVMAPVSDFNADVVGSADLSQASAVTIEQLRTANAVQLWLEKIARTGARYTELLRGFFGVTPRDARLSRPEYLGGGKTPVVISEVLQTSANTEEDRLGSNGGHAVTVGNFHGFKKFFDEYGIAFGILSVLPHSSYMQGMNRTLRGDRSREDMYFPQFAHLGEQEVYNFEVDYNFGRSLDDTYADTANNLGTFGYQSRYAEYKYIPDRVHGDFKDSLDFWHLGRKFNGVPGLSGSFIACTPDECNRIFNVTDDDVQHLWCETFFDCKVIRCMPKYGTPSFGL